MDTRSKKSRKSLTSMSSRSENQKREDRQKSYDSPNECWRDEHLPANERLFITQRGCKNASNYHENECKAFDEYIGKMTTYTFRGTKIDYKHSMLTYYTRSLSENMEGRATAHILPIQHMYGPVDLLKKKLNSNEKKFLGQISILKETDEAFWKRKRKPRGFSYWPDIFTFINSQDDSRTKKLKKEALRSCLDRRITFMIDCVYDCSEKVVERYLKIHLDFILMLQILCVKNKA